MTRVSKCGHWHLPLFAADYFDGHMFLLLVVKAFEHLAETALAKRLDDLVAVRDVVLVHLDVGAVLVVVVLDAACVQLLRLQAQVPDLGILVDLLLLELGQSVAIQLQSFCKI